MGAAVNAYEAERERRIAENKRRLAELGLVEEARTLLGPACPARPGAGPKVAPPPRKSRKARDEYLANCPVRRSARNADKAVNYNEDEDAPALGKRARAARRVELLGDTGEVLPELPDAKRRRLSEVGVEGWDSGRGVRWQGGRLYDSKFGVTCHWCRQKTLEDHVTCTAPGCGSGRRLPVSFCKMCLRNRHGEDVQRAEASGCWVCPACRGSCGDGCTQCCNCGPCRKKAGLAPTHQVIKQAREHGFGNVHDYLVWLNTGASVDTIAARKASFADSWGKWLTVEASSSCDGGSASGDERAAAEAAPSPAASADSQQGQELGEGGDEVGDSAGCINTVLQAIKASTPAAKPAPPLSRKQRVLARLGLAAA